MELPSNLSGVIAKKTITPESLNYLTRKPLPPGVSKYNPAGKIKSSLVPQGKGIVHRPHIDTYAQPQKAVIENANSHGVVYDHSDRPGVTFDKILKPSQFGTDKAVAPKSFSDRVHGFKHSISKFFNPPVNQARCDKLINS